MQINDGSGISVEHKNSALERQQFIKTALPLLKNKNKPVSCGSLQDLVQQLHDIFSEDRVNIEYVNDLLESYKNNPLEWKKYAKFDRYRYTRNLVDEGNGKFNLMIVCWREGQASAIHDHANSHCFMKMLHGELTEIRFANPEENEQTESSDDDNGLRELSRTVLGKNCVCYINDSIGLHRVENASHTTKAVSLHLYCPPFDSCSVFNQRTGQRSKCKVTFWSKFGQKHSEEAPEDWEPEDV